VGGAGVAAGARLGFGDVPDVVVSTLGGSRRLGGWEWEMEGLPVWAEEHCVWCYEGRDRGGGHVWRCEEGQDGCGAFGFAACCW
jgi:hypothetical protein